MQYSLFPSNQVVMGLSMVSCFSSGFSTAQVSCGTGRIQCCPGIHRNIIGPVHCGTGHSTANVPDTASYIRGWMQMVLTPNDLFSWNNKYNEYVLHYSIMIDSLPTFQLCTSTYSVHAGGSEPWRGHLLCLPVVFPFHWDSRLASSCVRS